MNTCIRFVSVLFWKRDHMWKHYLPVTNRGVGKGGSVCHGTDSFMTWRKHCKKRKRKHGFWKNQTRRVTCNSDTDWSINQHLNLHLKMQHAWHTLGSPCAHPQPPLLRLTRPSLLACGRKWCSVLDSSSIDTTTYLPTQDWILRSN